MEQINTQEYATKMREQVAFGRVDLTHEPTKDNRIESTTMLYASRNKGLADLIFNKEASQEQYKMRQMRLEQRLDYTHKVKASGLLAFSGYYIHEKKPQFYDIDRFYFDRLFPQYQDITAMNQSADSRMDLLQGNVSYLTRMGSHLLFLQLGDNYRTDQLNTALFLLDSTTNRYEPLDYKNDLKYRANDLYFLTGYEFDRNSLKLSGTLLIHYYSALLESKKSKGMNALRLDPKLRFIWKINKRNKLSATYAFESTVANISELYTNAILSGFRIFKRGYDKPEVLRRSNCALNYNYGDFGDDFTANLLGFYIKNHDAFSSYLTFKDSTFESRSILVHGNSIGNVTLQLDYYIKPLKSNAKLSLGTSYSSFERAVNEERNEFD